MSAPRFSLEDVLTLEASFRREEELPDNYDQIEGDVNIKVSWLRAEDDIFKVYVATRFSQENNNQDNDNFLVAGRVTIAGYFKQSGEMAEEVIQSFCEVNAPAILFPFIREAFASLSLKARLRPILLQPVNFVELAKQRSTNKDE